MKRGLAWLLSLALVLGLFAGLTTVFADNDYTNTGVRHEVCTALSAQAEAYYTGDYTWETLSVLPGTRTDSSAEAAGSDLFKALHGLMRSTLTTTVTYSSLAGYWRYTDAAQGTSDAVLFYSDAVSSSYNREHVWPKSQGNFYQDGAGSDLHHLRPTNSSVNSTRSHYTMGNVRGVLDSYDTYSYGGKTVLYYDSSYSLNDDLGIVEVNDEIKGDVARILLYVYAAYGEETGENLNLCVKMPTSGAGNNANQGNKVIESLDTLLDWCELDPVDTWEMSRNDCVQNVQGNRNVFIDYPELAWMLFERELPDMQTPSGYAHEHQAGDFTVTAVPDDEAHGTVTGSGRHFTAHPAEGWYAAGWTLSPEGAAEVSQNGNSFRLSNVTADCTLTVVFAEKSAAVLHFSVPAGVSCADLNGYLSESVILPTPEGTPEDESHEFGFVGWVESPVEAATDKPDYLTAGKDFALMAEETTLYALYTYTVSDGQGVSGEYAMISQMADGDFVIGAKDKQVMMNNDYSAGTYMGFSAASFTGDVITNAKDENVYTFAAVGDYYAVYDCNGYALRADGKKKVTLDPEKTEVGAEDTVYLWSVEIGESNATITPYDSTQGSLQYNGSSPRFTTYTTSQVSVALYGTVSGTRYYTTLSGVLPPDPCAEGHTPGEPVEENRTEPTCTEAGGYDTVIYCMVCNAEISREHTEIPATGHLHTEIRNYVAATCTTDGYSGDTYCTDCGVLLQKGAAVPATGHSYDAGVVSKAATCTEDGVRTYLCKDCGSTYTTVIKASGHFFGDWIVTTPATATMKGEETRICTYCGAEETREIKPLDYGKCYYEVFKDCPTPEKEVWYHEALDYVVEAGLMNGTSSSTFEPKGTMTRAMIVAVLYRMAGSPKVTALSSFKDVDKDAWYAEPISWAQDTKIVTGYSDDKFGPNDPVTRQQIATILWRNAGRPDSEEADMDLFTDADKISAYAEDAMNWAVAVGILNGDNYKLKPTDKATRAEFACMMMRLEGGSFVCENMKEWKDEEEITGIEGTYTIRTINGKSFKKFLEEAIGDEEDIEDFLEAYGLSSYRDIFVLTLKTDGTFKATFLKETYAGEWKLNGNKLTLDINSYLDDLIGTCNKDCEITLEMTGVLQADPYAHMNDGDDLRIFDGEWLLTKSN